MTNNMFGNSGFIQNFIDVNIDNNSSYVIWGGINEILTYNNLTLYPSPATDQLFISSKENIRDAQLKVYDAAGKLLLENKMSGMNTSINVKNFADGIYLLEVSNGVNVYRNRFVKQ